MADTKTILKLETPDEVVSVSIEGTELDYVEFMELVEMLIVNSPYSKHEVESYILDWADEIRKTREN